MARSQRSVEKEAYWRAKLDEQRQSGLNVRAFCRVKSISEPSFYAWRRALGARDAERTASGNSQFRPRLIPVSIVSAQRESVSSIDFEEHQRLEIVTPGGFTLRFAAETIARLLDLVAHHASPCPAKGTCSC
jgi:hypothetical protein